MKPARGRDLSVLRRLVPFVRAHIGIVIIALLLLPFLAGVQLAQPYLIRIAIDQQTGEPYHVRLDPSQIQPDWSDIALGSVAA